VRLHALFLVIILLLSGCTTKEMETTTTTTQISTTTTTLPIKTERDIILEIVRNATEGKRWTMYEVGYERYNCADFTADSVLALREKNYTAYPVCGWLNHNYHSWLVVEINDSLVHIEPQVPMIIYPSTVDNYDPSNPYLYGRRCIVRGVV